MSIALLKILQESMPATLKFIFEQDETPVDQVADPLADLKKEAEETQDPDRVAKLMQHPDPGVLNALASNPTLPDEHLFKLAGYSDHPHNQDYLANKEPSYVMRNLDFHSYKDYPNERFKTLAKNPKTPPWLLKHLAGIAPDEVADNPVLSLMHFEDPNFFAKSEVHEPLVLGIKNNQDLRKRLIAEYPQTIYGLISNGIDDQAMQHILDTNNLNNYKKITDSEHRVPSAMLHKLYQHIKGRFLTNKHKENEENIPNDDDLMQDLLRSHIGHDISDEVLSLPVHAITKDLANRNISTKFYSEASPVQMVQAIASGKTKKDKLLRNGYKHLLQKLGIDAGTHSKNNPLNLLDKEEHKKVLESLLGMIKTDAVDYGYFKPEGAIATHILSMHPDTRINRTATDLAKQIIDHKLAANPKYDHFIYQTGNSENPVIRTYVRTHPGVINNFKKYDIL